MQNVLPAASAASLNESPSPRNLLLAALVALAAGCGAPVELDDPTGTARAAQFDTRDLSYQVVQNGVLVAATWAGTVRGQEVEFWVAGARYQPGEARTITGARESCAAFRRAVCGRGWRGATYYRSTFTRSALDCTRAPEPCAGGATSFLGRGSYRAADARGAAFATTHVEGACEYWAMDRTVSEGVSVQAPLPQPFASVAEFHASACAASPAPTLLYVATYDPVDDFCAADVC